MARLCKANNTRSASAESDVEAEVERPLEEPEILSVSLAIQARVDEGYDLVSAMAS